MEIAENNQVEKSENERSIPAIFHSNHLFSEINDQVSDNKNGWSKENVETVRKWQLDIEKSAFIYGEVFHNLNSKIQYLTVTTLIISALMTLIAAINVTLSFLDLKWLVVGLSIAILVGVATCTIITGVGIAFGWKDKFETLLKYVERLNQAWFAFETELNISPEQRQNATDFLKRADGMYMYLMQQSPEISLKEITEANHAYQIQLAEEQIWSRKFRGKQQQLELVVDK